MIPRGTRLATSNRQTRSTLQVRKPLFVQREVGLLVLGALLLFDRGIWSTTDGERRRVVALLLAEGVVAELAALDDRRLRDDALRVEVLEVVARI